MFLVPFYQHLRRSFQICDSSPLVQFHLLTQPLIIAPCHSSARPDSQKPLSCFSYLSLFSVWRAAATRKQLHPACRWKRSCRLFAPMVVAIKARPLPPFLSFRIPRKWLTGSVSTPCSSRATTLNWNHWPKSTAR